jgi:hypothetical protein
MSTADPFDRQTWPLVPAPDLTLRKMRGRPEDKA